MTTPYQNIDHYQEKAAEFISPKAVPEERVLGLFAEAGEVAGVFQKMLRGDYGLEGAGPKLFKELGDVMWYLAGVARDNGWKLSEVAEGNINKLEDRKLRNVILGSGDNR